MSQIAYELIPYTYKMILKNRFDKTEIQRWWWDHTFCAECMSNQAVSVHHIDGCKKEYHASLFNSIPLCLKCHTTMDCFNNGGVKGEPIRTRLTKYTMKYLVQQGKGFDPIDRDYLESIQDRVNCILLDS